MKAAMAIAADFRQRIARGELRDGDALPVESELTEQVGVSKGVLREALRILETEGLVEVRRGLGGGPTVRHPSISKPARAMGVYLQIGDVLVMDVFEARDRIIGGAVERLAETRLDSEAAALAASVRELEAVVGDFDVYHPILLDLGETVVQMAGNATEHMMVVSLRHIIAAELEVATRGIDDVDAAVDAEVSVAKSWADVSRFVTQRRPRAARRAYSAQAELIREGLSSMLGPTTVVDVFGTIPTPTPTN
jgi:GntR family transcriptional regulator, transcriptional repressor for pyruvate dehydrogenase complex